ncbi:MAG TPA: PAAR domain-containing protein [Mycobacteriales bacterium]|nr:PAAR domain-containing protein [Mycobacteriales bacterium]
MGLPAAKQGDRVVAVDLHVVVTPSGVATPLPHPFAGMLDGNLSPTVRIEGRPAATVGSTATNLPPHLPAGGTFQRPPANRGTVQVGSPTVRIGGKPAARAGDPATTCNDPADLPVGQVVAAGAVRIG